MYYHRQSVTTRVSLRANFAKQSPTSEAEIVAQTAIGGLCHLGTSSQSALLAMTPEDLRSMFRSNTNGAGCGRVLESPG